MKKQRRISTDPANWAPGGEKPKPQMLTYKQVAEALIKQLDLHEGIWGIYVEFGIKGINVPLSEPEGSLVPAALIPVLRMGLQKFDAETWISVDAAKVNPAPSQSKSTRRRK